MAVGLTAIVVFGKILAANEEIMIGIQLPEFTVDDIEVLVGEVIVYAIDIFLFFDAVERLESRQR